METFFFVGVTVTVLVVLFTISPPLIAQHEIVTLLLSSGKLIMVTFPQLSTVATFLLLEVNFNVFVVILDMLDIISSLIDWLKTFVTLVNIQYVLSNSIDLFSNVILEISPSTTTSYVTPHFSFPIAG